MSGFGSFSGFGQNTGQNTGGFGSTNNNAPNTGKFRSFAPSLVLDNILRLSYPSLSNRLELSDFVPDSSFFPTGFGSGFAANTNPNTNNANPFGATSSTGGFGSGGERHLSMRS